MVNRPKLKTYQAWTMSEALSFVKEDLGADAVILHTRTFDRGGFLGFGRRAVVEITAARAEDMPRRETPKAAEEPRSRAHAARTVEASRTGIDAARIGAAARAYGPTAKPVVSQSPAKAIDPAAIDPATIDMESEREKTRRLAQAMMVRLERESAERAAAAVNEQATLRAAERFGFRAREFQAPPQASAPVFSTAQRFVLVPEPTVGASGAARMTAALVRPPEPLPSIEDLLDDAPETARPSGSRPEVASEAAKAAGAAAMRASAADEARSSDSARSIPEPSVPEQPLSEQRKPAPQASESVSAERSKPEATPAHAKDRSSARNPIEVEPAPAPAAPSARTRELDEISAFVGRVLSGGQPAASQVVSPAVAPAPAAAPQPAAPARAPALETMYAQLIEQEVARELADRILREVEAELAADADSSAGSEAMSPALVRAAVERRIAALVPAIDGDAFRMQPGRHGARRIAFVGPTGVGKTTTLAKIAAQLKLKRGLRVGIVAADTYRIAAVDQLRTYAEILGLPVEIASSPSDAARACADLADVDVILIDTAGRSQNDCMKLSELRAFLASAQPDETHLVLSATAGMKTLEREAKAFGAVGVDRIVLTKLDEAAAFGTLVSLVERLGKQVSFLTHGQEVPDHIESARGTRLAALVLGSEVR